MLGLVSRSAHERKEEVISGDRMALERQPGGLARASGTSCYEIRTIANYSEEAAPRFFSEERARLRIKHLIGQGLSMCSDFVTSLRCINFSRK